MDTIADPTEKRTHFVVLRPVRLKDSFEAYCLPVAGFPIAAPNLPSFAKVLRCLTEALANARGLTIETFLQFNQFHFGDASTRFSDHACEWMPQLGLGVWPDREPPTLWTKEEFENLGAGARPRPLMHQVFRLSASQEVTKNACELMLGFGTIVQMMTTESGDSLLGKTRALLLPPIKEPVLSSFPFYVPLLNGKSLETASTEQLEAWFCGASAYIRESVEDRAILIASREPLRLILEEMGGRFEPEPEPRWQIPC